MPEIKHNFTGGKMNKDLDERLIPNGQYSDAMNIQVSTSEGSDVGTVQNILGNKEISSDLINSTIGESAITIGSIADEKNDTLYYLVWTSDTDYIFEYLSGSPLPVPIFVDKNKDVLKFQPNTIVTGINIIDGMLFWTDNNSEPKKINIERCKQGTPNISSHTELVNDSQSLMGVPIEEKHITVIRKAPKHPLSMVVNSSRDVNKIYTGVINISSDAAFESTTTNPSSFMLGLGPHPNRYNFSGITTEDGSNTFNIKIEQGLINGVVSNIGPINDNDGLTGWHKSNPTYNGVYNNIAVGTKIALKAFDEDGSPPGVPLTDFNIKGVIEDIDPSSTAIETGSTIIAVKAVAIDGFPPLPTDGASFLSYAVDMWDEEERLFEFKFPRFSYRYKFEDGEYSAFAPFTQVAFIPGSFDYHPRKGYNLGMTNRASNIELTRIVTPSTPKDVVAIDILFKDETSPNIYIVDTIRPDQQGTSGGDNTWISILGDWRGSTASSPYVITEEQVQSLVPSNQLLRPYDNVPRKALAQDVTGNRVVYANYLQNYNLETFGRRKYMPEFSVEFMHRDPNTTNQLWQLVEDGLETVTLQAETTSESVSSIKSLREYQLGVVFTDEYGRETPVISNSTGTIKLGKEDADKANVLRVMLNDFASRPQGLTHLKFYVKETSGEYYNMAMDRFYDAEDGNVWLAFPSSDRNKLDIDTFLILKKGSDQDTLVVSPARYKVIAIENEAPDFIKTTRLLAATEFHSSQNDLFTSSGSDIPLAGNKSFSMDYPPWGNGPGRNLDKKEINEILYVEFSNGSQFSDRYKITSISHDDFDGTTPSGTKYYVQLDKVLSEDVNFISNDPTGVSSTSIEDGTIVNIYRYKVENKPMFDGRFFVKIYEDETFTSNIGQSFIEGLEYRTLASKKIYLMKPFEEHIELHWENTNKILTSNLASLGNDIQTANLEIPSHNPNPTYPLYDYDGDDDIFDYYSGTVNDNGDAIERMNMGFYAVDEFASMATYFRKMRIGESSIDSGSIWDQWAGMLWFSNVASTTSLYGSQQGIYAVIKDEADNARRDIRHLTDVGAGPTNFDVEYPTGTYWIDHPNCLKEFGEGTTPGHTARFEIKLLGDNWFSPAGGFGGNNALGYHHPALVQSRYLDADDPIDTDVWFIDAGPIKANRHAFAHDDMPWIYLDGTYGGLNSQTDPANDIRETQVPGTGYSNRENDVDGHKNQDGLTTHSSGWRMQLGYGGVKVSDDSDPNTFPDHFNVGDWFTPNGQAQNSYYATNSQNTPFIQSIQGGTRFRWKEDPTEQIYTLGANIDTRRSVRHSPRSHEVVAIENGDQYAGQGGMPTYGAFSSGATSMAERLSFNFTAGFKCNGITPAIAWNPVEDGAISGGLEVKLTSTNKNGLTNLGSTSTGQTVTDDLVIYTDSVISTAANSSTGVPATLHVGMALKKYTNLNSTSQANTSSSTNLNDSDAEYLVVREILPPNTAGNPFDGFQLLLGGYKKPLKAAHHLALTSNKAPKINTNLVFCQVGMNGYSHNSEFNINTIGRDQNMGYGCIGAVGYSLEFLKYIEPEAVLSENPAIWETEPKEIKDLDVYYEASAAVPIVMDESNIHDAVPVGSKIMALVNFSIQTFLVIDYDGADIVVAEGSGANTTPGSFNPINGVSISIIRPDGLIFTTSTITATEFFEASTGHYYANVSLNPNLYDSQFTLPWFNCYSFGNGVESNRIRDNFNLPFVANGVRVSTTLEEEYKEEHRKYGLIYSGIYNSNGGLNNLNQFIQAEKITKDINPIYGSIQKLHSRDSDLVTLCEDKCLRILANKDAVFNADGNTNLTATQNVLGQTIPFSGEFGISTNPESFASEAYRAYFTDKVRGTVMRLSKDGLTPISEAGMKDWFKDNLKLNNTAFGSYDDKKEEYNLTLANKITGFVTVPGVSKFTTGGPYSAMNFFETNYSIAKFINVGDTLDLAGAVGATVTDKINLGGGNWKIELNVVIDSNNLGNYYSYGLVGSNMVAWDALVTIGSDQSQTVSYKENVKGWVSFKSFTPENALSMANDYYTFQNGKLWIHHDETVDRNTFYNTFASSSVEVVLNDEASSIKGFQTLNYEGSQTKVGKFKSELKQLTYQPDTTYNDQEIYNLSNKDGWYVENVYTDKEEGYVSTFIEKEGKWFNNINRYINIGLQSADTADFTFQGIGFASNVTSTAGLGTGPSGVVNVSSVVPGVGSTTPPPTPVSTSGTITGTITSTSTGTVTNGATGTGTGASTSADADADAITDADTSTSTGTGTSPGVGTGTGASTSTGTSTGTGTGAISGY